MTPKTYKDNFFNYHLTDALSSASEVVPIVLSFIKPASVIDIGSGVGAWLSIWKKNGVNDIKGVDGDYVDTNELLIEKHEFIPFDLEKGFTENRKYDLATCLEVAEHIKPVSAELFIKSLCKLSDVVLFSAAIPGQEGTFHFNEQYPGYWVELFEKNGFAPLDVLRNKIWLNQKISWWYRQNIMFFVRKGSGHPLEKKLDENSGEVLPLVHPWIFDYKNRKIAYYEKVLNNPLRIGKFYLSKLFKKR